MNLHELDVGESVRQFVATIPSDLLADMAELERAGKLTAVVKSAFAQAKLQRAFSSRAVARLRNEIFPQLYAIADKMVNSRGNTGITEDVIKRAHGSKYSRSQIV